MTENQDALAARLREARAAAGYENATDAARAMGIEPPTYLAHENASRGFKGAAPRYAEFFRVNLDWLLLNRGKMRRSDTAQLPDENVIAKVPQSGFDDSRELRVASMPRNLPVHGSAACGADGLFELNGQTLEYVRRPPRLEGVKDAYALYVHGESMSPWREHGDLVYVHPHLPLKIGAYVVVQLHPEKRGGAEAAYIKRLVRRTATSLVLMQFNPREEIPIPVKRVKQIHPIMDWSELMGL